MIQVIKIVVLGLLLFGQSAIAPGRGAAPAAAVNPYALPYTDPMTGSGALGAAWTQETGASINLVKVSGAAQCQSGGYCGACLTGPAAAATQSITFVYNYGGSNHADVRLLSDVGITQGYQWAPRDGLVWFQVGGSYTGIGTPGLFASGDTVTFDYGKAGANVLRIYDVTTSTMLFSTTTSAVTAPGYACLQANNSDNPQSFGAVTLN